MRQGLGIDERRASWCEDDVAQIVHDLKSPVATIALETELLDERLHDGQHVDIHGVLARITRNVSYLDRMIRDLLDSYSIEAGRFEIHRHPTELRAVLERILERDVATRDGNRVVLDAPIPFTIAIDELRIERVVVNLLHNALKYAPDGGTIVVRLEIVPDLCRISVCDAGTTLGAADVAVLFDKYRRGTTAGRLEGSGLGLHVCKQIVEAHGGTIGFARDTGSRFFFELPTTNISWTTGCFRDQGEAAKE